MTSDRFGVGLDDTCRDCTVIKDRASYVYTRLSRMFPFVL